MIRPRITLTTDFGWGSPYVAQLKGVIASLLPDADVVDIAHDVPAFSLLDGEVLLRRTAFAFPVGTVHVVVVDPGVGTARRPIAVAASGMYFVGPDNGLLGGPACRADAECVVLDRSELFLAQLSPTFHGRDIFAPIACELAGGAPLLDVGSHITDVLPSTLPSARRHGGQVQGQTLSADRFGNFTTNIPACWLEAAATITVDGQALRRASTYGDVDIGALFCLTGSDGFVEIAVRQGSAFERLNGRIGHTVLGVGNGCDD